MRPRFLPWGVLFILLVSGEWLLAQSPSDPTRASTNSNTAPPSPDVNMAATNAAPPSPAPVTPPAAPSATDAGDSAAMAADDFLIDGVPYAKVLYLEGNVWIRGPDDTMFHRLAEDEPIAQNSVIYTGFNGILDFATGPGVAVRMVPLTVIRVTGLPQPATLSNPTTPRT